MKKSELLDLSRECGLEFHEEECAHSVYVSLAQFANAILERAAQHCDHLKEGAKTASDLAKDADDWESSTGYACESAAYGHSAAAIRRLKEPKPCEQPS